MSEFEKLANQLRSAIEALPYDILPREVRQRRQQEALLRTVSEGLASFYQSDSFQKFCAAMDGLIALRPDLFHPHPIMRWWYKIKVMVRRVRTA